NSGAMLVVMHDRDVHLSPEFCFNLETFRGLDVLQVYSAKSGFQRLYNLDKFIRVFFGDFNIEYVDARKFFEEHALAFHDWFCGLRPDIPQAQYSRSI